MTMRLIEECFGFLVRGCILLTEVTGIIVILISMTRAFIGYLRRDDSTRIELAKGIMLGLEFKVGSEVLRSVVVSGWSELGTLAAIILLRTLLTLLLHWEINSEEKRINDHPEYYADPKHSWHGWFHKKRIPPVPTAGEVLPKGAADSGA